MQPEIDVFAAALATYATLGNRSDESAHADELNEFNEVSLPESGQAAAGADELNELNEKTPAARWPARRDSSTIFRRRDQARAADLREVARLLNWPALQLWPHLSVVRGEPAWERFLATSTDELIRAALSAADDAWEVSE